MECLHRLKWSKFDGLGVLVISPTRELAYQTFEVLKKIGKFHDFSAGLVIGGKVCDNFPTFIKSFTIDAYSRESNSLLRSENPRFYQ